MSTGPRLMPIPVDEWDERARTIFADMPRMLRSPPDIVSAFAHHPPLLAAFTGLLAYVYSDDYSLPPHDREVIVLRTGVRCDSPYELAHHIRVAHRIGMTDAEIDMVREGPGAAGLPPFDALLVRAVDELHEHQMLSRETWDELARSYAACQLLDLVFTVGKYTLVAMIANALGLEDEGTSPE